MVNNSININIALTLTTMSFVKSKGFGIAMKLKNMYCDVTTVSCYFTCEISDLFKRKLCISLACIYTVHYDK